MVNFLWTKRWPYTWTALFIRFKILFNHPVLSHFDVYNDPAHEDYVVKSDPSSSNGSGLEVGPGETEIVCRLSLAAGESCTVSISARLETRVAIQ